MKWNLWNKFKIMNFQNLNNNLEFKIIISLYLKFKEKSQISSNTYFQTFQNEILIFQVISIEKGIFPRKILYSFLFQKL